MSLRADKPSLSVVIPAFNAAPFLHRVLPAAQEAARGRAEVLVVDAGSPDETAELAAELGARVVRLPVPTGPSGARNAGAAAVDTDLILFIDADCPSVTKVSWVVECEQFPNTYREIVSDCKFVCDPCPN